MRSNVTKKEIEQARAVNIYEHLLYREPHLVRRISRNEICLKIHDSLRISPSGKWHWCSRGIGGTGNAVNFFMVVFGVDFVSAVQRLCQSPTTTIPKEKDEKNAHKSGEVSEIPVLSNTPAEAISYLVDKRGIDKEIVELCVRDGILHETAKYKNCVFFGWNEKGQVGYGCLRGTRGNFHGELSNSDKRYSFVFPAQTEDANTVVVAESPIDVLSCATLDKITQGDMGYKTRHYLSLGGTSPLALEAFLLQRTQVENVLLALDADSAGRKGSRAICCLILEHPILATQVKTITDFALWEEGTDPNETLIRLRKNL